MQTARVAVRNVRRDGIEVIRKAEKDGLLSEMSVMRKRVRSEAHHNCGSHRRYAGEQGEKSTG